MKILVVGGGGREHAICWKLSNEKDVEKIYCAPGNPGIAKVAECVNIGDSDIAELVKFAKEKEIEDRKSTRLNSSHIQKSRMPSSA